ncbi:MAG: hypothetical protein ACFE89_08050 [Candidatus Hodarchaeota archaeon]
MGYIPLLAKIGKGVPGSRLVGKHFVSLEFKKAVNFLYHDTVQPEHILGGVLFFSVTIFGLTTLLLNFLVNSISAMILGVTIASMSGLLLTNSISSEYNRILTQIAKHTPYVLEELATIFLATGSVFESIQYVSRGEYDQISTAFLKMISSLNQGVAPEQLLMNFAYSQPSITLRRGLLAFVQLVEASNDSLDTVILDAHENLQRHYEGLTMQWESRMMVYSGLLVFLPVIILLGVAIRGLAEHPLILILPVFQFGLSKIMQKMLFSNELILLGE